ncbi:MAG: hypothetical protein VKJ46_05260 [Leptolyngbyaceae bacterium]|nr:hypothetical protein [Leptolyngbyaceae bacterium]
MKLNFASLLFLTSISGLSLIATVTPPASAQCVMTDISIQAALRGAKQPAQQTNTTDLQSEGACVGNTITQTSTQVYTGSADRVIQQRTSSQRLQGSPSNRAGVTGPTIKVPVEVKVDVYNPASDPTFLKSIP